jgi:hypothetical protein
MADQREIDGHLEECLAVSTAAATVIRVGSALVYTVLR